MSAIYANCCFRYHKGTDFQANHNVSQFIGVNVIVVLDTTKVQIFKQITTVKGVWVHNASLFQIPQRYRFSSKSQHARVCSRSYCRCFRYHKGTDFQANHNISSNSRQSDFVVLDTTKVQIFKQITTVGDTAAMRSLLFQIPQRYRFSSKSQQIPTAELDALGCFRYHKGTDFQANHNRQLLRYPQLGLFQIPQRYRFSSKSQRSV